jgi:hypothetical protein
MWCQESTLVSVLQAELPVVIHTNVFVEIRKYEIQTLNQCFSYNRKLMQVRTTQSVLHFLSGH